MEVNCIAARIRGQEVPDHGPSRSLHRAAARWMVLGGLLCLICLFATGASTNRDPQKPGDLFTITNVWSVHLTFTAEQWNAMEPTGGGGGFFGRQGRPGGGPGGPGGFGPAMFIAPAFMKAGDQNEDGKLAKEEFHSLGEKWFAEWDKEKSGKLNSDQLRAGLNGAFAPPEFGGPGGGAPGGRGIGMNLQGAEGKRNGLASAMGIEFKYVHADMEFGSLVLKDVAVRYKGNGTFMQSRGSLKRSLKIDLNKYVKGRAMAG